MRRATALGLAAVVLLSGCAGVVPDGGGTATDQAIVRGTPASPPGVDAEGVTDVSALLSAHRRSLVTAGFVLETATSRRGPGGTNVTVTHRIVAAPALRAHRHRTVRRFGDRRRVVQDRWTDGAAAARRVRENGSTVGVGGYGGADATALTRSARLRWFLRRGDFEVAAITVRRTGTRYVLAADGPIPDRERDGHLAARIVVTGEGRITSLVATVTTPGDGGGLRVEAYEYHLRRVGRTGVERPPWAAGDAEPLERLQEPAWHTGERGRVR